MNTTAEERLDICENLRIKTAEAFAEVLKNRQVLSEIDFRTGLLEKLSGEKNIHAEGWYNPPPYGVAALFGSASNRGRLSFKTLRTEEFWPRADCLFEKDSLGIIYASPVDVATATIGDFGMTVYNGGNEQIKEHLVKCLEVVEKTAEFAEVGMQFKDVCNQSQMLLEEYGLKRGVIVLQNDASEYNIGHTIPWSYENPTQEEQQIISGTDFDTIKNLISKKRIYLNPHESFSIAPTCAFTAEIRITSAENRELPNTFFHLIVIFQNGKKKILGNFNAVFDAIGMDFIKSNY